MAQTFVDRCPLQILRYCDLEDVTVGVKVEYLSVNHVLAFLPSEAILVSEGDFKNNARSVA